MLQFKAEMNPALHPGQSAAIYLKDERIVLWGCCLNWNVNWIADNGRTLVFELQMNKLAEPYRAAGAGDFTLPGQPSRALRLLLRKETFPQRIFLSNVESWRKSGSWRKLI